MARQSLFSHGGDMHEHSPDQSLCNYVVLLDEASPDGEGLRDLAQYLSVLGTLGCEVIVLDLSSRERYVARQRVLRWVSRHLHVSPENRSLQGDVDLVRAAAAVASCEKVIVADRECRFDEAALRQVSALLDCHEVVEPQDYIAPLPWWGGIDAARVLVRRGFEPRTERSSAFAFRRSAIATLRALVPGGTSRDHVRRLERSGAEVFTANSVFVRRELPSLPQRLKEIHSSEEHDLALPMRTGALIALIPLFVMLAWLGGLQLAGAYAGAMAMAVTMIAVRGWWDARGFFPFRACLLAPVWLLERSVSVHIAVARHLIRRDRAHQPAGAATAGTDTRSRAAGR